MSHGEFQRPSAMASIDFWCNSTDRHGLQPATQATHATHMGAFQSLCFKARIVTTHPTKPWVFVVDDASGGDLSLWNRESHTLLWKQSLQELCVMCADRRVEKEKIPRTAVVGTSSAMATTMMTRAIQHGGMEFSGGLSMASRVSQGSDASSETKELYHAWHNRASTFALPKSEDKVSAQLLATGSSQLALQLAAKRYAENLRLASAALTSDSQENALHTSTRNTDMIYANILIEATRLKDSIGEITQIVFADTAAVLASGGCVVETGVKDSVSLDACAEGGRVVIVGDHGLIVVNLSTRELLLTVGVAELGGQKVRPSGGVTMLTTSTLAVGCSDGTVRIYNITTGALLTCLPQISASRSDVVAVRVLPVSEGHISGELRGGPASPLTGGLSATGGKSSNKIASGSGSGSSNVSHPKVVLLTVYGDGQAGLWEVPTILSLVTGRNRPTVVSASYPTVPVAVLSEMAGARVSRQDIHFDADLCQLIIVLNEHKLYVWSLYDFWISRHLGLSASSSTNLLSNVNMTHKRRSIFRASTTVGGAGGPAALAPSSILKLSKAATTGGYSLHNAVLIASPSLTAMTLMVTSRMNQLAILQVRRVGGDNLDDSISDTASVAGGAVDRQSHLEITNEFSLVSLFSTYFHHRFGWRLPTEQQIKIYALSGVLSSPETFIVGTSLGALIVTLPPCAASMPTDGFLGAHSTWGAVKVVYTEGNVRMLDVSHSMSTRLPEETIVEESALYSLTYDIEPDVLHEVPLTTQKSTPSLTQGLKNKKATPIATGTSVNASGEVCITTGLWMRPLIIPSPSGNHVAVVMRDTCAYVVYRITLPRGSEEVEQYNPEANIKPSSDGSAHLTEIARGACAAFAWIGSASTELDRDLAVYVVPTFERIDGGSGGASGGRRKSMIGKLFSKKETRTVIPPSWRALSCTVDANAAKTLVVTIDPAHNTNFAADRVVSLESGLLGTLTFCASNANGIVEAGEAIGSQLFGILPDGTDAVKIMPIGATHPPVRMVRWNTVDEPISHSSSHLAAWLMRNGAMYILRVIGSEDGSASLSTVASTQVGTLGNVASVPVSLQWLGGSICVSTGGVIAVHMPLSSGLSTEEGRPIYHLQTQHIINENHSIVRRNWWYGEVIGIMNGGLVLAQRDNSLRFLESSSLRSWMSTY